MSEWKLKIDVEEESEDRSYYYSFQGEHECLHLI